jgi:DNA-directed RNA polymerase subunit RPC12/RpoP
MENETNKWDINLDKVLCPECGSRQPALRIPKNVKQLMWGGWVCEKCSCKMDKHGNKITEKDN